MSDLTPTPITIHRFTPEELAERNHAAGLDADPAQPVHIYTEDELDEMYEHDPLTATRISRDQEIAKRNKVASRIPDPNALPPEWDEMVTVLEEARKILLRDGGDLELIEIQGTVIRVRMKGNCVGCPNAVMDLKNVVEKIVTKHFPQVTAVHNTF